jgi:hypothetical protein
VDTQGKGNVVMMGRTIGNRTQTGGPTSSVSATAGPKSGVRAGGPDDAAGA